MQMTRTRMDFQGHTLLTIAPEVSRGQLVWFHGGGWCLGSAEDEAEWAEALAVATGYTIILPDYPLAPQVHYPELNGWCVAAWHYLAQQARALKVPLLLGGDSSGGHLALCSLPAAIPDRLILIYPVTTLLPERNWGSWKAYTKGWPLSPKVMDYFYDAYCPDTTLRYGASPLEQLATLPPLLMISAKEDILFDQQQALIQRLGGKQLVYEGAHHIFLSRPEGASYRQRALSDIAAFLAD